MMTPETSKHFNLNQDCERRREFSSSYHSPCENHPLPKLALCPRGKLLWVQSRAPICANTGLLQTCCKGSCAGLLQAAHDSSRLLLCAADCGEVDPSRPIGAAAAVLPRVRGNTFPLPGSGGAAAALNICWMHRTSGFHCMWAIWEGCNTGFTLGTVPIQMEVLAVAIWVKKII